MGNIKFAFRVLLKSPFVSGVAILSLALGIGTNTAIFSFMDQLLLRALPVREPARLANLEAPGPKPGNQSCGMAGACKATFSYPMLRDLEKSPGAFSGIGAHFAMGANIAYKGQTSSEGGVMVSGGYFPVLGIQPALGRLFTPDDDRVVGANSLVVLGYAYWQSKLGGDPGVLNSTIIINGQSFTIIGVAPQGFDGTTLGRRPSIYVPISMRGQLSPGFKGFEDRRSYWIYLFGRLKPGVTLEQAKTAINAVYKPIINDVEVPLQKGMSDVTMAKFKARELGVEEGSRGQSMLHEQTETPLLMLFAITGIVLLIACANIANLLLARAAGRSMEMAVRLSLGASRRQLLTQLFTESLVLAMLGGAASLVVARWTLSGIITLMPDASSVVDTPHLSLPMILFAGALSILTGLLFGMFPALHSTRPDLVTSIRSNAGQISGHRAAAVFRTVLATTQIALSMTLLISAGLFIKSLTNVTHVDLGLRPDSLVTFEIEPVLNGYTRERSQVFFARVEQELSAIPGVTGVTAATVPILAGDNWGQSMSVEGITPTPDQDMNSSVNDVGPGYFKVIGATMLSGRDFTMADALGGAKVAIVNETFAKKFNLGKDAVGKHISNSDKGPLDTEIVGLVRDNKYSDVKDKVPPVVVSPWRQDSTVGDINFYVRTSLSPTLLLKTIPAVIKKLDPNLPVEGIKTLPQVVKENISLDSMISTMAAAFAVLATILAAVGLYGVLAYSVAQRTREIGVRMALGASGGSVRGMVLRQVGIMTAVGAVIGVVAAYVLALLAKSLLYGLSGTDPWVMVGSTVLLSAVALSAGFVPALRASRISPMQALRYE